MTTRTFVVPARTLLRLTGVAVPKLADHGYYMRASGCNMVGVATSIYPEPGRVVAAFLRVKF